MKTLLLLAVIMAIGLLQVHGGLLNFRKMIKFTTGKESVTSYRRYGCYCGTRGRGIPKDATDWCCRAHDCCYKNLESRGCRTKFLKYNVTYQEDQIVCEDADDCKSQVCQCDKIAANCFAANLKTYNKMLRFYNKFRCRGAAPAC
uniref:Phospholipase A2 n=1 Tax=Bos indicus x Bos taurus TaxID=30522 RepID=A0A4W2DVM5_BOBOX